jgi:hypothetical protein
MGSLYRCIVVIHYAGFELFRSRHDDLLHNRSALRIVTSLEARLRGRPIEVRLGHRAVLTLPELKKPCRGSDPHPSEGLYADSKNV